MMTLKKSLKWINPQDISALELDVAKAKVDVCYLSKSQAISYQIATILKQFLVYQKSLRL